jgi:hypothetical protein
VLTAKLRARILSATRRKPKDGSTHWNCRKLAAELGISKDAAHRVWKEAGLKPNRLERYMASDDPDFETKAADIIGLYLKPPEHAAVFCVDEKTAIQALGRLDPVLPLSPGRAEHHGFEYYRHGPCPSMPRWKRPPAGKSGDMIPISPPQIPIPRPERHRAAAIPKFMSIHNLSHYRGAPQSVVNPFLSIFPSIYIIFSNFRPHPFCRLYLSIR